MKILYINGNGTANAPASILGLNGHNYTNPVSNLIRARQKLKSGKYEGIFIENPNMKYSTGFEKKDPRYSLILLRDNNERIPSVVLTNPEDAPLFKDLASVVISTPIIQWELCGVLREAFSD